MEQHATLCKHTEKQTFSQKMVGDTHFSPQDQWSGGRRREQGSVDGSLAAGAANLHWERSPCECVCSRLNRCCSHSCGVNVPWFLYHTHTLFGLCWVEVCMQVVDAFPPDLFLAEASKEGHRQMDEAYQRASNPRACAEAIFSPIWWRTAVIRAQNWSVIGGRNRAHRDSWT